MLNKFSILIKLVRINSKFILNLPSEKPPGPSFFWTPASRRKTSLVPACASSVPSQQRRWCSLRRTCPSPGSLKKSFDGFCELRKISMKGVSLVSL